MHFSIQTETDDRLDAGYLGLRMTSDEFLHIPDDGYNYELVDGIVSITPSPEPAHQSVTGEIYCQLANYLHAKPVGKVWPELDVCLGKSAGGGDLVYRPEVVFVRQERLSGIGRKLSIVPDMVAEVVSHGSRRLDTQTKRQDYERFGVAEYWIMDPQRKSMAFLRLQGREYIEMQPGADRFAS